MTRIRQIACSLFTAAFLVLGLGCSSSKHEPDLSKEPSAQLFIEASRRVIRLTQEGRLPGFDKGDHGVIRSYRLPAGEKITFPYVVSMQIEKAKSEDSIYWVVLQKDNENSTFEVREEWRTDWRGEKKETLIQRHKNE